MNNWTTIKSIAENSGGYLVTKQVEDAGISRTVLKQYVDSGDLIRVCKGRYILSESITDEYALLQSRNSNAVFSHGTALFLWGMSDRVPHVIDMTVPQGTNVSKIKRDNPDVRFHYIRRELHSLGISKTQTPQGLTVSLYDRERCICDLILARKQTDMQLYSQALKGYFSDDPNLRRLLKYGEKLGLVDKIRTYMEVLS